MKRDVPLSLVVSGFFGACLLLLAALFSNPQVSAQAPSRIDIFIDDLDSAFQNWSWSTDATVVNGEWEVTINDAWGALRTQAVSPVENAESLSFRARGSGQILDIGVIAGDDTFVNVDRITLTGAMQTFTVNVDQSEIIGVYWQDGTGSALAPFVIDDIYLLVDDTPTPDVVLNVDPSDLGNAINPHIYGMSFPDAGLAADIDLPINRWGGNAVTRYNWKESVSNKASDWFFLNVPEGTDDGVDANNLPDTATFNQFIEQNVNTNTDSLMTVTMIGWTPSGRNDNCGFHVDTYGPQDATEEPWRPHCGNGYVNGEPLYGISPADTSIPVDEAWAQEWIEYIDNRYGANEVQYYALDNEPMLWDFTHRDVHPAGASYDEVRDLAYTYGPTIKATNPNAQILGPVLWGWTGYWYSAQDIRDGGPEFWLDPPDRNAHNGQAFVNWYLEQMAAYEQTNGQRILDYLDIHFYPQQANVALSNDVSIETQRLRLRSTRALWDPTYEDESWIGESVELIPRMKGIIDTHYPGTKFALTEYNWGATEHINGALAQADILGIFGREGVDMAMYWANPQPDSPLAYAYRMYRNYDGAGGKFGGQSVSATSTDQEQVSVYAATRADGALTIMLVNKALDDRIVQLNVDGVTADADVYQYSNGALTAIEQLADASVNGSMVLPRDSIRLLVVESNQSIGPVTQVSPNGSVSTTSPTFSWQPEPTATGYVIVVYDATDDSVVFMNSSPYAAASSCTGTSATDTCSATPSLALTAGNNYTWLVRAVAANGTLGPWSDFP